MTTHLLTPTLARLPALMSSLEMPESIDAALPHSRGQGLPWIEVTTDPDNVASQRVIEHAGGRLFERFVEPAAFGGHEGLRYRIPVPPSAP